MELLAGVVVIIIFAATVYILALFLGLVAIIVLSAIVALGIPIFIGITISPQFGITLLLMEALLLGIILGYTYFSKASIKRWDERLPKNDKSS
jgi:uncharacterized membrane protein